MKTEYPEHAKLEAVKEQSQAIGEFLENAGYTLCVYQEEAEVPRWIDSRTGTDKTPRDTPVLITGIYTIENLDWHPAGYYPVHRSVERVLAEYFEIDLDKIEIEKRQMLDELRAMNASRP